MEEDLTRKRHETGLRSAKSEDYFIGDLCINSCKVGNIKNSCARWITSGVGQSYGKGYPLGVLFRWMSKI